MIALGSLVLVMAIVEYSSAWYIPQDLHSMSTLAVRPFGSQYRLVFWALTAVVVVLGLLYNRLGAAARAFAPFAPFLMVAVLTTAMSPTFKESCWYLAQWLVMVAVATFVGAQLTPAAMRRAGLAIFAAVIAGSLLLYVVQPSAGAERVGGHALLRGLFAGKNLAGWFAAVACVWVVANWRRGFNVGAAALLALALLMVILSRSATSLVMLLAGGGYLALVSGLRRATIPTGMKSLTVLCVLAVAALAVQVGLPQLLALFGRDATLSGRTELWGLYWRFMQDNILLGRGVGAFAAGSELNTSIAPHLEADYVVSVHSLYLSLFGETGLIGAAFYVGAFLYIAVAAPFRDPSREALVAATLSLMILGAGFTEARDTLSPSLASFLVLATRAAARRSRGAGDQPARRARAPSGRTRDALRPSARTAPVRTGRRLRKVL